MEPRRLLFAIVATTLLLELAAGCTRPAAAENEPTHVIDTWNPGAADENTRALSGSYTGFGAGATGGEGRPLFTVTSLADSGIGSLRSVLEAVGRLGGGRVVFTVAGDVVLLAELVVPTNTTIDGLSAPAPGITLWGDRLGAGGGVLEINASNVIVRGLRIRNAVGDGIQIAAKDATSVARIVVDHCSVTNSGDGGIDVTGSSDDAVVGDVTLSWNYLAANGGPCANKTWCGGGSLVKYGVTRISAHANVWDKNLRRNPSIDGGSVDGGTLADVRGNVVGGYVERGTQLRDGARGNVVGNFFAGDRPLLTAGAFVYAAGNAGATAASETAPYDVLGPLGSVPRAVVTAGAGAPPFDPIDAAYRDGLATYEDAKNALVGPGIGAATLGVDAATLGVDGALAETAAPPLDATTLAHAERALRLARTARTRRERGRAMAQYQAVLDLLADARGMLVRPAEAAMASAALGVSELADPEASAALAFAESALAHARRSGDGGLERRVRHRLRRLLR
jgi:pectate lyase